MRFGSMNKPLFDNEEFEMSLIRSPSTSRRLTLEDAIEIWRRRWLGEAQHVLAAAFGVNQGRIAEVLSGTKFPEAEAIALNGRRA
jgi:hypothetical protein